MSIPNASLAVALSRSSDVHLSQKVATNILSIGVYLCLTHLCLGYIKRLVEVTSSSCKHSFETRINIKIWTNMASLISIEGCETKCLGAPGVCPLLEYCNQNLPKQVLSSWTAPTMPEQQAHISNISAPIL